MARCYYCGGRGHFGAYRCPNCGGSGQSGGGRDTVHRAWAKGEFDDGTPYTVGMCSDPRFEGYVYVSIGDSHNHTTYIVQPWDVHSDYVIKARGSDRSAWAMIAIAIMG